jgi:prolyl oligopeptidase
VICAAALLLPGALAGASEGLEYPATKIKPVTETIHGVEITDNYRWLEDGGEWVVKVWDKRQNRLTRRMLDGLPERERIVERLTKHRQVPLSACPWRRGDDYYYWHYDGSQELPALYVRRGSYEAAPEVVLDPNEWADSDEPRCSVADVSPDGRYMAYLRRKSEHSWGTLHVRNTETGEDLDEAIEYAYASSFFWTDEGDEFYYERWYPAGKGRAGDWRTGVFRHELGADWKKDTLVFGDGDPQDEPIWFRPTSDGTHLFFFRRPGDETLTVSIMDLRAPEPEMRTLLEGAEDFYSFDVAGGVLYCKTDAGAPRNCICACDVREPDRANWRVLIPEQRGVIVSVTILRRQLLVELLEDMEVRLLVYSLDGRFVEKLALPRIGCLHDVSIGPDDAEGFIAFSSILHPWTVYRYETARHRLTPLEQTDFGIDLGRYKMQRVWYTSKDGTPVPMLIVHKRGLRRDGRNPVLLYGYGGFRITTDPSFDPDLFVWLDAGGVYAVANLRGGGELGRTWHEEGKGFLKQNTFDDFIAAAEYLIAEGYTNPKRLAISGASNGGLLVGAALTQRPDLFRAVVCDVPVLDMVRYHEMGGWNSGPKEYGTAEDPDEFRELYGYSPYHRVREGVTYPAVFLQAAAQDTTVDPAHARKMAALLQSVAAPGRPVLLWVEPDAGHHVNELPKARRIGQEADRLAWLMWQLDMIEPPRK